CNEIIPCAKNVNGCRCRFQIISQTTQVVIVTLNLGSRSTIDEFLFLTAEVHSQLLDCGFGHITVYCKSVGQFATEATSPGLGCMLRFPNGSTVILLSEMTAVAVCVYLAPTMRRPTATAATMRRTAPIIAPRITAGLPADAPVAVVVFFLPLCCLNFSGNSRFPSSSV